MEASEAINVLMSSRVSYDEDYEAEEMEAEVESLRERLSQGDYSEVVLPVKGWLEAKGISMDENSMTFKRPCDQLLIDGIDFYEIEAKRARGDYAFERNLLLTHKIDSAVASFQAGSSIKCSRFSKVAEEFIGDLRCNIKQQGKWERRWRHGKASIERIANKVGADFYLQDHMSEKRRGSWEFIDFNLRLLKKSHGKQSIHQG